MNTTPTTTGPESPLSGSLHKSTGTVLRRRDPSIAEKCATAAALERKKPIGGRRPRSRRRNLQTITAYTRLAEAAGLFRA